MVSPRMIFVPVVTITACISIGEAFPDPREAGRYVLNATRSLWQRAEPPRVHFSEPRDLHDPLKDAKVMKFIDIDRSQAKDRHYPDCGKNKLGTGANREWSNHHELCQHQFNRSPASEGAGRNNIIQNLNDQRMKAAKGTFHVRSQIEQHAVQIIQGWPESTTEWSNNPGRNMINHKWACELCKHLDDSYIVPRAYIDDRGAHQCVCKKWAQHDEKFMVCNCDLCDALLIPSGIRAKCMDMAAMNLKEGYLSRYMAFNGHNAFFRLYNDNKKIGKVIDLAIADIQKDLSVCKSGAQGKEAENHFGRLFADVPVNPEVCPAYLEKMAKHIKI